VAGLLGSPKKVAPKYFYDAEGSVLFERIVDLPEYYPGRAEFAILADHGVEIADLIGPGAVLVEFGSGSSSKVRLLLKHLQDLVAYVPVDISGEFLSEIAARLRQDLPRLEVQPVAADFTKPFAMPAGLARKRKAGFFPGSTIGNFDPDEAQAFLRNVRGQLGRGATFIVGVDLVKEPHILDAAYNDSEGVTAAFNLNLLARANRELDADFDVQAFEHRAFFNSSKSRIEMHLVSRKRQIARIAEHRIEFAAGETIHTESSYKYTRESFAELARKAGWRRTAVWTDADQRFSVQALQRDD